MLSKLYTLFYGKIPSERIQEDKKREVPPSPNIS